MSYKTISKLLIAVILATLCIFFNINAMADPQSQNNTAACQPIKKKHNSVKKKQTKPQQKKALKDCNNCWNG